MKFFKPSEVTCKCGCGMMPQEDFMARIELLRQACGFPFIVTSCARCPDHNSRESSTGRTGPHTTGRAIDISCRGADALMLIQKALLHGFTGIGVNQKGSVRFIHLDDLPNTPTSPRPFIWSY